MTEVKKENKLWRPYDEKGTLLGTYIPNCLYKSILDGKYTYSEVRVLLYIARMTCGFNREISQYLSLEDFANGTGINGSHVSATLRKLLNRDDIMRHTKNGNKHMYSINLLSVPINFIFIAALTF